MKKKIVFAINYFYPDLASTGQLMTDLCKYLQKDFDVTVIASQPGYAGEKASSKEVFEVDYLDHIKIIRVRLPEVDKSSKISRIRYILYYFILANIALLKERNVDIVYTISQPPILGGMIGTIGKLFKQAKHVYNIQDFNPEQAEAVSYTKMKAVFKLARAIDKLNCRYANRVIVVGQDMSETLKKRFKNINVPEHLIINNWTNENDIIPMSKDELHVQEFLRNNDLEDKFIVMYSGNIGLYYDLENIIKITKYFKEYPDLVFLFIGEGAVKKEMQEYVNKHNITNVKFLPYQPIDSIKYSLNSADVHLVVNQKGIKGVSVPSKIYGVMAAGKPIIGVLEQGSEAQLLIDKSNCGTVVEPQNYQGIVSAIEYFFNMKTESLQQLGLNGRKYLNQNLKREISINKYREVLKEVSES
ncbi:glycosyltransferase family 4 protein [Cytobacillus firmus]|uniref:glycosyltransferase family 4 protein n=1 Tax=Cytobacillus firmus TaxID=1399 RepID=UPI0024C1EF1F|nr:glycosyltransferase family 4 protein [Cytobacillus firmus]WHY61505.1 glycosyltransferase family 4 protein [Cytobacillus firmus]